jgi:hypothetical protein
MRKIIYPPSTLVKFPSLFGSGKDGNVTISSNTTLTRDMYYENLTIKSGKVLNTNGYKIFVRNVLKNNGIIRNNGGDANETTPGEGAPTGSIGGGSKGGTTDAPTIDFQNGFPIVNAIGGKGGKGGDVGTEQGFNGGDIIAPPTSLGEINTYIQAITISGFGLNINKGYAKLRLTSNQSIPNSSWQSIEWADVETQDGYIISNDILITSVYFRKAGLYLIKLKATLSSGGSGIARSRILKNGSIIAGGRSSIPISSGQQTDILNILTEKFSPGDRLSVSIFQNTGASLQILGTSADESRTILEIIQLDDTPYIFYGGSGGGAGAFGDGAGNPGAGGGGGGTVLVAANILDNSNGTIEAKGGKGANATLPGNKGGGGGGGGGAIVLVGSTIIEGNLSVEGGLGGAGTGTGQTGSKGQDGQIFKIKAL